MNELRCLSPCQHPVWYLKIIDKTRNACYNWLMNTQEELIKLKEKTEMNWKAFAQYFDIPYRTMQDWYLGKRSMPDYLLRLMSYKIKTEELRRPR